MAVTALHTLYAVDIDDVLFDQVQSWGLDPAIAEIIQGGDGSVDPTFVAVMGQSPRLSFGTTSIATALTKSGIDGFKVTSGAVATAYFQALAEGGTRAGTSSHLKATINEGLLLPRTLSVSRGGSPAVLTYDLIATYDGSNDPVVLLADQTLGGSPTTDALWAEGPAVLNGTTINGVTGITVNFGIQEIVQGGDGQVWPTFAGIIARQPSIAIQTVDVGVIATFGMAGAVQSATDSVIYLRKIDQGGTRVADVTAEHIKITVDEGRVSCGPITGEHGGLLGAEIRITPSYDGSNAILVISTGSAIT